MSPTSAPPPETAPRDDSNSGLRRPPLRTSGLATASCIRRLQSRYRRDESSAVAALARLRRGVGKTAHEAPDSWGTDGLEELATIREQEASLRETEPGNLAEVPSPSSRTTRMSEQRQLQEEKAVFLAVTLWAVHQQSVKDDNMHADAWGLGRSVRQLIQERRPQAEGTEARPLTVSALEMNETLRKRFVRIGTSTSFEMLSLRLREVVLLLRDARIPLDYARLADQVCAWQDVSRQAEVRRAWGRDFHVSARYSTGGKSASEE
ncbi:type I-E CRISPR-associated protein Cse2/CasB [Streptomyces polyrhachis]|uniref:Type I-E CRISPR-associated protein Cse2/CasB n=1 Tax=Streptomyces polyrhachis TaxID=1282885 RepID=A0ABW2GC97_9ACTN